ncbi:valine--tRNA ligase [Metallumcola ferriviriculae]|uniref:Valine--tRNA ligase n=1 Tax=Metallumcola ferriviriculae TaxID=3039180 RepID=A0AAU0ULW1_9FIRM|nr:valine--tRNA ligase [Desulfitibacteraceae bacterium MK1]
MQEQSLSKTYDPSRVEEKWYHTWEEKSYFVAEREEGREAFSIVMPPPNVTGSLHLGHALDSTLQDILTRWRRMQGRNTLWLPGTDHAGIATQAKVEEQLAREGKSKNDLGRDEFLERVWDWKHQYGDRITRQLRTLGASCDWSRERFTMDDGCSDAVREVFVRLYEKGLIYRGNYIINWCPKCQTTISDIEVEHQESAGSLWHIRYPIKDSDEYVVVATTRPETMLGDTAVAVHPDDSRYKKLVGKTVILPVVGREIPIVADEYVDPEFGSGAVKITPAHDPNDFEIGQRHQLPQVVVIDKTAKMTAEAGKYRGMDRYECREILVQDLMGAGFLVETEEHRHAVGQCYRCDTVVEPLVSRQWFVRMGPLAKPAIEAVEEKRIRFVPERFTKVYLGWLENIRDWCISRQLWWGHRIPVWYCQDCGEIICSINDPDQCTGCGSSKLQQDPDVLDTWFSSGLWPFSTLGWPGDTADLRTFYPTSVLVTGRDIIFFWVARMIFMALEFRQEVPFKEVFIHGLVLDAQGRKMSKSLGNGVDPIEIIEKYGADTLRFMLITGNTPGNDLRFHFERLEGTRNFANKIWNAARFVIMNLEDDKSYEGVSAQYTLADRWILSRFNSTAKEVTRLLGKYELGEAARLLYEFIWSEFCDWYIELAKERLYGDSPVGKYTARKLLKTILSDTMKLLHPFMPFITEEIWQQLDPDGETIMQSSWPEGDTSLMDDDAEREMGLVMAVIRGIRNIRGEMNVPPGRKARVILAANSGQSEAVLTANTIYLNNMAHASPVEVFNSLEHKPEQAAAAVEGGVEIFMPLQGLIDFDKEKARLEKDMLNLEKELSRVEKKLGNPNFLDKAPENVVEKEIAKREEFLSKKGTLQERLSLIAKG